jgi:hypothetical protein
LVDGRWVAARTRDGLWQLARCGQRPKTIAHDPVTLGGGWMTWQAARAPIPRRTAWFLRRLRDGRVFRIGDQRSPIAHTARQAVILRDGRIAIANLPR